MSEAGTARIAATALCLLVAIGIPWCYEQVGSIHPMRGDLLLAHGADSSGAE